MQEPANKWSAHEGSFQFRNIKVNKVTGSQDDKMRSNTATLAYFRAVVMSGLFLVSWRDRRFLRALSAETLLLSQVLLFLP